MVPADQSTTRHVGQSSARPGATPEATVPAAAPRPSRREWLSLLGRITSYNVCYTKLLRIPVTDMWDRVIEQRQFLFSLYQRVLRVDERGPSEVATLELSWALEMAERNAPAPYVDPLSPFVRTLRREIDLAVGGENQHVSRSSDLFARFRVIPARDWSLFGESLFNPGDGLV